MCVFRLGDGRCYISAQSLEDLPASSGGPALCSAVGAAWKGKASVCWGAVLARRCSLGVDGQPSHGLWQWAGPPLWVLLLRWEIGKEVLVGNYVCLPW